MEDINILKKYDIIERLGQGSFGSVSKIKNKVTNKIYALKQIPLNGVNNEKLASIENEANILSKLSHKNIINYYGSYKDEKFFNIFMEYCEGSDLRKLINDFRSHNHPIPKYIVNYIIKEITNGIKEIHDKNLIHRDLKPDNILITNDFQIKIADFGISKQLTSVSQYAKTETGTLIYMAPEIISNDHYNNKVDLWALGCILYELCTLTICFYDNALKKLIDIILYEEPEEIDVNIYGKEFQNLINLLLNKEYQERPDINEFYNILNETKKKYNYIIKSKENISFDIENKDYYDYKKIEKRGVIHEYKDIFVELGTRFTKYGFAHSDDEEDFMTIPTSIGNPKLDYNFEKKGLYFIGKDAENLYNDLDLVNPIKKGNFYDWDNLKKFLEFIFCKELKIDPYNHSIIISESPSNTNKNREKLAELIFEYFSFSGLYIQNKAVLKCLSNGKFSGININIGESGTHITPIFDLFKLSSATISYDIGGQDLTEIMAKELSKTNPKLSEWKYRNIIEDIKAKVCHTCTCSSYFDELSEENCKFPVDYKLPDGKNITIKHLTIKCPEILFRPSLINKSGVGLSSLFIQSIEKCDMDIKEELLNNIILTGGTSQMHNLKERLNHDIVELLSSSFKDKVEIVKEDYFSKNINSCSGAALVSEFLNNNFIYKADYLEYGDSIIHRYFF